MRIFCRSLAHRSALGSVGDRLRASMATSAVAVVVIADVQGVALDFNARLQGVLSHRLVP